jgi:DNA-binding NarL/FixJ family response regulator
MAKQTNGPLSVLLVDDHAVVREGYRRLLESQGDIAVIAEAADAATAQRSGRSRTLNPKTIANHQTAIKQKLGAETAIQLLRKANELGFETLLPT